MEANEHMNQMIKTIAETLLWETVSADVENTTHLPAMLDGLGYVNHELIAQISRCEMLETSSFDVIDVELADDKMYISFEMPFTLTAWNDTAPILRIMAVAEGTCSVPDLDAYHWNSHNFYAMDKPEILSHRDLVEIEELYYSEVECNELSDK